MKTENWLYIAIAALVLFEIICFILILRSNKKKINEAKNKMDGQLLGSDDLSEWDMGIQFSEQPFVDGYQSAN